MKRILLSIVIFCLAFTVSNAQYYYNQRTFLARHTDHAGYNPGLLNSDLENAFSISAPNGWAQVDAGTPLGARWSTIQALPFSFTVNGTAVTNYKVSTTGVLTFDTATALAAPPSANVNIPSALIPNNSLMVWGLIDSASNDKIISKTFGTAPNRQHWVMFNSYSISGRSPSSCYTYMAIVMEETTNKVYFVDMRNTTSSSCSPTLTVGIQLNSSTAFPVSGSPNINDLAGKTPLSADNEFYEFIPGSRPQTDVDLYNVSIEQFKTPPTTASLSAKIINYGANPLTAFDFKYEVGGTVYTQSYTGVNVATNMSYSFTHNIPVNIPTSGRYGIHAWVEATGDADLSNNDMNTQTHGLQYATSKKVLFEEATGTWCGWCPRGTVYMDSLRNTYPNTAVLVAVHDGDPMITTANSNYDTYMGYEIGGYPSGLIDRKNLDIDPSSFFSYYNQRINDKAPCEVYVLTSYNAATAQLQATVHAHFATDMQGDYRFNAVVVEDDVTGTGSTWAQTNYYSGSATILVGAGHDWNAEPDPIPAANMHYDHVGRVILGGWDGMAGSLPNFIPENSDQSYTFSYTLPVSMDPTQVHVVGWVCDPITGNVYNSARSTNSITGINNPATSSFSTRVYPNPAANICNIDVELEKPGRVTVEMYDVTGRMVYRNADKDMSAGQFTYPLNTSILSNGIYNVKITVGNEQTTQRVVVQQ